MWEAGAQPGLRAFRSAATRLCLSALARRNKRKNGQNPRSYEGTYEGRATPQTLPSQPAPFNTILAAEAQQREATLNYHVPSGRYWEQADRFDPAEIDALDALWLAAANP